ncbi:MAG: DinB family protein [Planctomycetes bacterium]|nr:DinB family protein [Planctomycetota bacterium]
MNPDLLIGRLAFFAKGLRQLLDGLSDVDARWRPSDGGWSILEIVCHLADEDLHDFRARLELLLKDPKASWPALDPRARVQELGFNEQDFKRALQQFEMERARNVAWLKSIGTASWTETHDHPSGRAIRAGDLLASWVCHDALHLGMVADRLKKMALRDAPGFSVDYAG